MYRRLHSSAESLYLGVSTGFVMERRLVHRESGMVRSKRLCSKRVTNRLIGHTLRLDCDVDLPAARVGVEFTEVPPALRHLKVEVEGSPK